MVDVAVYILKHRRRSEMIGRAMAQGIKVSGDNPVIRFAEQYKPSHSEEIAVFYGFEGNLPRVMEDFRASGRKAVFIDLGYWGRTMGGKLNGYHKVSVNSRHPTDYFQNRQHTPCRFKRFSLNIKPYQRGGEHILLAGMGDKAAAVAGLSPEQWEKDAVAALRQFTDMPILYRPKPSWAGARPLEGTIYASPAEGLPKHLAGCYAVVTHHSNVGVDALLEGYPVFCWGGVALPFASSNLAEIDSPLFKEGREQWASDIAWTQWNVEEMKIGAVWRYLKEENLI